MNLIIFVVSFFISELVSAQTPYIAPTNILAKKGYQLGFSGEYFQSSKKIDKDGEGFAFTDGEKFSRMQAEVQGLYGLTENLQIGGGVRFRQNDSAKLNTVTNEIENETSVGVQSSFLNFIFAFKPVDRLQYVLEGLYRHTPYTNDVTTASSQGDFILGDEGNEYSGGMGVTYSFNRNNFVTTRGGYRVPGKDLSSEFYWQVEGALVWKKYALLGGVDGNSSLSNDPNEKTPANKPNFNTGSTYLYNSTNREWIAPYLGLNYSVSQNWRVETKASQVVSGLSTDLGSSFSVALIRRVDPKNMSKVDKKFKSYDFDASVTKISAKKGYVVIDKGLADDVQKGMKIDFYEFNYVEGETALIGSGVVIRTKAESAIIKILNIYNPNKEIKEGSIGRGSYK